MNPSNTGQTATEPLEPRLPFAALLALAMTGFICIMTETLPAGLLPAISAGMAISPAMAGQMVTAYALGSMLAAIPLMVLTQGWRRRRVLLATIVGFLLFNSITALSEHYVLTLVARFFAGAAAGLAWSLIAGYARRMVPPSLQGRALAIAMVGTPIALSLGVPLGTWIGGLISWRMVFALMSLVTVALVVWVVVYVPDYPGQPRTERLSLTAVLQRPGVRSILAVVMAWMLAHNVLYIYIAPLAALAGLSADVDLVLLDFGVASLVGIGVVGHIVDRYLRGAVLLSLASFALVALLLGWASDSVAVIYLSVFVWGLTFGGAATLLQTALADMAGPGADAAMAMNVVTWNGAIAGGGVLGGLLLEGPGATALAWVVLALALVALGIASAHQHGFPAGERVGEPVPLDSQ